MIQPYNSEQPNVSFTYLQHLDRSTELNTLFLEKQRNARLLLPNFSLPELREEAAYEIHYRIQEAERRLVAPNLAEEDYELGTATHDDDLFVLSNTGNGLFISAEHATSPVA